MSLTVVITTVRLKHMVVQRGLSTQYHYNSCTTMEGLKKPAKSEPPRGVFFKSYEGKGTVQDFRHIGSHARMYDRSKTFRKLDCNKTTFACKVEISSDPTAPHYLIPGAFITLSPIVIYLISDTSDLSCFAVNPHLLIESFSVNMLIQFFNFTVTLMNSCSFISHSHTRLINSFNLKTPICKTSTFQASYFNCIVKRWIYSCSIAPSFSFSSLLSFLLFIEQTLFDRLRTSFDIDWPSTWTLVRTCFCHKL